MTPRELRQSLADAQVYWEHFASQGASNLSADNLQFPGIPNSTYDNAVDWSDSLRSVVQLLISERCRLIKANSLEASSIQTRRGRLLALSHESSMSDGLAASETEGLVNDHNCPLPLFWVGLIDLAPRDKATFNIESILLSWIPNELIDRMHSGVYVTSEQCLEWLDCTQWKTSELGKSLEVFID